MRHNDFSTRDILTFTSQHTLRNFHSNLHKLPRFSFPFTTNAAKCMPQQDCVPENTMLVNVLICWESSIRVGAVEICLAINFAACYFRRRASPVLIIMPNCEWICESWISEWIPGLKMRYCGNRGCSDLVTSAADAVSTSLENVHDQNLNMPLPKQGNTSTIDEMVEGTGKSRRGESQIVSGVLHM